ncbi:hypothetical protein AS29_008925 [Bacillus sp. SJS]|nr:hypothetical protein AS29_008925 [Bacillus sp. SJS]
MGIALETSVNRRENYYIDENIRISRKFNYIGENPRISTKTTIYRRKFQDIDFSTKIGSILIKEI